MKRFPFYHQLDSMDCGSTCLRMISEYYGLRIPASYFRDLCCNSNVGVSMLSISDAAEAIGFHTLGIRASWKQLHDDIPLPCIVHWNQNHFIIVYKIHKDNVHISDPAIGLLTYNKKDFLKGWIKSEDEQHEKIGMILLLEPTPDITQQKENIKKKRVSLHYIWQKIFPYKKVFAFLLMGMGLGCALNFIFPILSQKIVDVGIGQKKINIVVLLLLAQTAVVLGSTVNSLVGNWLSIRMSTRLSISFVSDFLRKLMRLPISFFESRSIGDILERIGDFDRLLSFISVSLLGMLIAAITFLVYGVIMVRYSMNVLIVFICGSIIYSIWTMSFMKYRRKLNNMRFQLASNSQSNLVQTIIGMQEIKLNSCENQKRKIWEQIQMRLFKVNMQEIRLKQVQNIGGILIDQTKNILISFIAAKSVIDGSMTLGMMMAIQYIVGQLNAPILQFVNFIYSLQDVRISSDRLGDVFGMNDEEIDDTNKLSQIPYNADIRLQNVSFRYGGRRSRKILDSINLCIPANKITAIVGTSGSGKTTMLKIILGLYKPTDGQILLGGIPLDKYKICKWRNACGAVMQDGFIFSDSIANNICIDDTAQDKDSLRRSAETANISSFVKELPLKYNTKIGAEGAGLSKGQKQRILIARTIYKDAKYLFYDEATNSLDASNERNIMNNLYNIFKDKTVVIIAHRLSTVKNADNIIVLDNGKIVEMGNHHTLIAKRGAYFNLVRDQLELGE